MTSRLGEWYGAWVPDVGILWGYMAFTVLGFRALVCATAIFSRACEGQLRQDLRVLEYLAA